MVHAKELSRPMSGASLTSGSAHNPGYFPVKKRRRKEKKKTSPSACWAFSSLWSFVCSSTKMPHRQPHSCDFNRLATWWVRSSLDPIGSHIRVRRRTRECPAGYRHISWVVGQRGFDRIVLLALNRGLRRTRVWCLSLYAYIIDQDGRDVGAIVVCLKVRSLPSSVERDLCLLPYSFSKQQVGLTPVGPESGPQGATAGHDLEHHRHNSQPSCDSLAPPPTPPNCYSPV
ncbi:uncharacterized protein LY79DRAFT_183892 [Colletotrichum navitas]|uniref:Uncharacterized protein n=1 Tax=Colletotrichum navitas TaxID=681940 RepID=A0AAD8Q034_9PEZI|nr:uncharacterized protein LY79DRAFT_183892 [Colletotrichum navitas]KAK1593310.1 hypothetical protein LY79DRAFT_183892 [Colletotrichum navitas]